jgi:molecular chaperone GrpE
MQGTSTLGARRGRSLRNVLAAALLLLAVTGEANAATLRASPPAPSGGPVGTRWKVEIVVKRAVGEAPQVPTITIANETTGARRSVVANPTAKHDVYDATVEFGSPGDWTYEIAYGRARLRSTTSIAIVGDAARNEASGSSSGWKLFALVASAVALAALGGLATLIVRRPRGTPAGPQPAEPPADLVRDRQALIGSYLYLYDVVHDEVLRSRLRDALAEAGVSELDSVGVRFDPSRHRATGSVPTDDPSLDGRIAEIERCGFSDRGEVLRLPEVLVYSASAGSRR